MASVSRPIYQAQLPHQHLYSISKQPLLAKYWIESILNIRLPCNDLCYCLRDGIILCEVIQFLVSHGQLSDSYRISDNAEHPQDRVNLFLKAAKDFGLQSSDLFTASDLINEDNNQAVASTILILAHTYSCKRFAGKSSSSIIPTQSQSYTIDLHTSKQLQRSKSEANLQSRKMSIDYNRTDSNIQDYEQGFCQEHIKKEEKEESINSGKFSSQPLSMSPTSLSLHYDQKSLPDCPTRKQSYRRHQKSTSISSSISERVWGEPPYDIQRPNCVPGIGTFDISTFRNDQEEMDDQLSMTSGQSMSSPPSPIDSFDHRFNDEDDELYDTKQSHSPSCSGDSGYGTRRRRRRSSSVKMHKMEETNNNAQGLFEALFAPVPTAATTIATPSPPPLAESPPSLRIHPNKSQSTVLPTASGRMSITNPTKKLSLLFSKSRAQQQQQQKKKEPHFVKFQTWSNNNTNRSDSPASSTNSNDGSFRRVQEEKLYKSNHQDEWINDAPSMGLSDLPATIKVAQGSTPSIPLQKQHRARRKTDASLLRAKSEIALAPIVTTPVNLKKPPHTRCKSIGSALDQKESLIPPTADSNNILDYCDEDGNLIARYKLGNVIGKGHFGTVYRALDLTSGKTVAVKQISLKDSRKADIEDMMQEASLLGSLTHPNIVKYEGFIQTHEHINIVLEYVENGSLMHTLKHFGNSLPEHLVATYCHDILQGLVYLHERDVVHCDLKAANILTTKEGDVKLSDFGVSLNLKLKNHEENLVSGTPFWMSPEVIELKGASVQSDIWSLGCTVIELCTGKPPYSDLMTMTAMFKIVEEDSPPFPENISDDLKDFLRLCFKKNPVERPKAKYLLHHPWVMQKEKAIPNTPSTPTITNTNNTSVLQNYLQKSLKSGENFTTIDATNTRSQPISRNSKISSPILPSPKPQQHSNTIDTIESPVDWKKWAFAKSSRRSMTSCSHKDEKKCAKCTPYEDPAGHDHEMIVIGLATGSSKCAICHDDIRHQALLCSKACGLVCHKQCLESHVLLQGGELKTVCKNEDGGANEKLVPCYMRPEPKHYKPRRGSDQMTISKPIILEGPKPVASVSTQLKDMFRFSAKSSSNQQHHRGLGMISEEKSMNHRHSKLWWKKKPQVSTS